MTRGKEFRSFWPHQHLHSCPQESDAPVPPRGFLLHREGSSQQDMVPLLPCVCFVYWTILFWFFFKYHKHRAPEMSLWIELVLRSDEQLWPSQCCSSLCCIWCPWMGLGGLAGETHFEMISRVSANTCPQPSFLLSSQSTLPRTASNHLHLLRTDPSLRNRHLQMP